MLAGLKAGVLTTSGSPARAIRGTYRAGPDSTRLPAPPPNIDLTNNHLTAVRESVTDSARG